MPSVQGRPPFRADHVGSLLRPPALRQAFRLNEERRSATPNSQNCKISASTTLSFFRKM